MSIEAGYSYESEKNVVRLHEEFVRSIRMWGRLHEMTFFIGYMARSFDFSAISSAPALVFKGKIPFIPKQIEGIEEIRDIMKKTTGG